MDSLIFMFYSGKTKKSNNIDKNDFKEEVQIIWRKYMRKVLVRQEQVTL
jgi:hypothetical protein